MPFTVLNTAGIQTQSSFGNDDSFKSPTSDFIETALNKSLISESLDILGNIQIDRTDLEQDTNLLLSRNEFSDEENNDISMISVPVLHDQNITFNVVSPTIVSAYLSIHYLWESGSRLLFMSIYWFKRIQPFKYLQDEVQIELVQNSWAELFVIGLVQCSKTLSIENIFTTIIQQLKTSIIHDKLPSTKVINMTKHIVKLKNFLKSVNQMKIDDFEFACLRMLCLFNVENLTSAKMSNQKLVKRKLVEKVQEYAYTELKNHIQNNTHSYDDSRYSKILLKLPVLRTMDPQIIEELFFPNLMGKMRIDIVIPYILKLSNGIKSESML